MDLITGSATYCVIMNKKLPLFQNVLIQVFDGIILLALVVMRHFIHIRTHFCETMNIIFLEFFKLIFWFLSFSRSSNLLLELNSEIKTSGFISFSSFVQTANDLLGWE